MFRISLEDCRFHAFHGVLPQERRVGNDFSVSAVVCYTPADILSDNLDSTISYADLYEIIEEEMGSPRNLLECVAGHIASRFRARWPQIDSGSIAITKTTPPIPGITGSATVTLTF